ncbi:hypothetical protein ANANG_G00252430 [Anguilla anguilla]|uniref:Uncharacterized protein n=1 Tax=Anguilla anguilla TaxID=7936 RepID=A0A9D3RMZ7_ANGAN|nr:hypothetical protein ANANG_G00252430 [Anguilla anguilla]
MDADDCNGRSYVSGSGDSSMEREFTGGLGAPSVSTPNSRHTSPSRSLSANSIKVELYSDEEPGRGAGPEERGADERDEGWKDERGTGRRRAAPSWGRGGGYGELASPSPSRRAPSACPTGS